MTREAHTHSGLDPCARLGWKTVPGFEAWVNCLGVIRGPSGQVLKPYIAPDGYRHVLIRKRKLRVHHAVLLAFGFPRPEGAECRHLDGDPANNKLANLKWGTRQENSDDKFLHGRVAAGEAKYNARLTIEQVRAIRADARSSRAIGREYSVSHTTILSIRRGDLWSRALAEAA